MKNEDTTRYKVAELEGELLDAAVAVAEGLRLWRRQGVLAALEDDLPNFVRPYSRNWLHGGPIIARENIGISPPTSRVHRNGGNQPGWGPSGIWSATTWHQGANGRRAIAHHETSALIAAMRCFVMSKLGDEVELP